MENHYYRPRICDAILQRMLRTSGAVLVSGPGRCGKTSTAAHAAGSALFLQDPERRSGYLRMAQTQPSFLLRGEKPRLLDEWQDALILWDAVRFAVDQTPGRRITEDQAYRDRPHLGDDDAPDVALGIRRV